MYWVSVVTEAGIFAILALGLDVVWGWSGDFDLMIYGYLALGSYMTFVLSIGKPTPPVEYIIGWHLPVVLAIQIAGTYTSSAYELVFAFLLLVLLMLFRPNGVFVRRSSVTVRA